MLLNQRVGKIIVKNVDKNFLYFLFKTEGIHNDLSSRSSSSGNQANTSSNDIENLTIPIPPLKVQ
ncbi:restriction endonuclease subunit S [Helicobacter sp. Faydin-H64]|uniref:Restriction endonuclease subunit S n=1 Tax=Helicobacter turcicus TaxID=2867412 RepID=A0ABS7JKS3_9HELI|nr:restriction endonuclease subunit S [Helicobacter turcicus]MBX7544852.1 restriction endonuclease subunit S [Helicobacter turcicus]